MCTLNPLLMDKMWESCYQHHNDTEKEDSKDIVPCIFRARSVIQLHSN